MRQVLLIAAALLVVPGFARAQDYQGYDEQQPYPDDQAQQQYYQQQQVQEDPAYAQYGIGYYGPHPVPYEVGNGYCYIEGAHTHEYAPFDQHLFRERDGYYYFVGDPVDFGYARPTYWFNGNHPIPFSWGGGYCYISWPHRHHYYPTGIDGFALVGGYYIFNGVWPSDYYLYRDWYWGYYGRYYRTSYFGNRYYTGRPARAYAVPAPVRINAPPGRTFVGAPPAAAWRPRAGAPGAVRPGIAPAPGVGAGRVGPAPSFHPTPNSAYVPPPAYRAAPTPGYQGAPAPAWRGGGTVTPPPAYHNAAPAPAYRPATPAPVYRPSTPAPAPARPAPAFRRR
jgi:hypothetical protein